MVFSVLGLFGSGFGVVAVGAVAVAAAAVVVERTVKPSGLVELLNHPF